MKPSNKRRNLNTFCKKFTIFYILIFFCFNAYGNGCAGQSLRKNTHDINNVKNDEEEIGITNEQNANNKMLAENSSLFSFVGVKEQLKDDLKKAKNEEKKKEKFINEEEKNTIQSLLSPSTPLVPLLSDLSTKSLLLSQEEFTDYANYALYFKQHPSVSAKLRVLSDNNYDNHDAQYSAQTGGTQEEEEEKEEGKGGKNKNAEHVEMQVDIAAAADEVEGIIKSINDDEQKTNNFDSGDIPPINNNHTNDNTTHNPQIIQSNLHSSNMEKTNNAQKEEEERKNLRRPKPDDTNEEIKKNVKNDDNTNDKKNNNTQIEKTKKEKEEEEEKEEEKEDEEEVPKQLMLRLQEELPTEWQEALTKCEVWLSLMQDEGRWREALQFLCGDKLCSTVNGLCDVPIVMSHSTIKFLTKACKQKQDVYLRFYPAITMVVEYDNRDKTNDNDMQKEQGRKKNNKQIQKSDGEKGKEKTQKKKEEDKKKVEGEKAKGVNRQEEEAKR